MNKKLSDLQYELEQITKAMTKEKYEYLKERFHISPSNIVRLKIMRKQGAEKDLLMRYEYAILFDSYIRVCYPTWKEIKWGEAENESLMTFTERALEDAVQRSEKALTKKKI